MRLYPLTLITQCNVLLFGLPKCLLDRLHKVQYAAARVILHLSKFNHITPSFVDLLWLPIKSEPSSNCFWLSASRYITKLWKPNLTFLCVRPHSFFYQFLESTAPLLEIANINNINNNFMPWQTDITFTSFSKSIFLPPSWALIPVC